MSTIIFKDKQNETSAVATDYASGYFQKFKRGEIDQRTNSEQTSVDAVKSYVREKRPYIEEQIGAEKFHSIICDVVAEYACKSFEVIRERLNN